MEEKINYNRKDYSNELLDLFKSIEDENTLQLEINKVIEKIEKKVSLMTFERNLHMIDISNSFLKRI
jgi:hypothetical protein